MQGASCRFHDQGAALNVAQLQTTAAQSSSMVPLRAKTSLHFLAMEPTSLSAAVFHEFKSTHQRAFATLWELNEEVTTTETRKLQPT